MGEGIGHHLPEGFPLPGIKGIPVHDAGGMGQQLPDRGLAQPLPQNVLFFRFRKDRSQRRIQPQPAGADEPKNLGRCGDLGQARHVKQGMFPGISRAYDGQRLPVVEHPHAGGREIPRFPVPLCQICDCLLQVRPSFLADHVKYASVPWFRTVVLNP